MGGADASADAVVAGARRRAGRRRRRRRACSKRSAIRARRPRRVERIAHFRDDPRQFLLLAERDGAACGLVAMKLHYSLTRGADVARITALVVAPDCHGQGIGRRLLREVETLARRNRRDAALEVTSNPSRTGAHAFYRACGYSDGSRALHEAAGRLAPRQSKRDSSAPRVRLDRIAGAIRATPVEDRRARPAARAGTSPRARASDSPPPARARPAAAAGRRCCRNTRHAIGAVSGLAHHAHLVLVVAVVARDQRRRGTGATSAADHRQVLVRDESQDRARQLRRRAGGDHARGRPRRDAAAARPARSGSSRARMRCASCVDVSVDQRVEVAARVQAERADPQVTGNAERRVGRNATSGSEHRRGSNAPAAAQPTALEQPREQVAAGIAVVQRVVEVEHDQRRVGRPGSAVSVAASNSCANSVQRARVGRAHEGLADQERVDAGIAHPRAHRRAWRCRFR